MLSCLPHKQLLVAIHSNQHTMEEAALAPGTACAFCIKELLDKTVLGLGNRTQGLCPDERRYVVHGTRRVKKGVLPMCVLLCFPPP